jgi:hypothetical protein
MDLIRVSDNALQLLPELVQSAGLSPAARLESI